MDKPRFNSHRYRFGPDHPERSYEATGALQGAVSDLQANRTRALVEAAGQRFDYRSFPEMGHSMHGQNPALYAATLREWAADLP